MEICTQKDAQVAVDRDAFLAAPLAVPTRNVYAQAPPARGTHDVE